mmetsp:Transcript_5249/g.33010  ORF Transcript_5249/g.33010 Transcript_5249/m.33010 type:complete len:306 (-) Transcript_5249:597-1514(-)|eukprot:CAMPEP_0183828776 /NCGR_PEP_ID=MMETSP0807_2-20130328/2969_1 /TAXON_ID=88271 /ORGANISM="Picocystis salinarum, Strain CCMP1897" /LENGTH=305 /DNA_ID=CAMNT_0026073981 /DNA_START=104 /DNA_END=1021 /DNA_ORIENTATION=+
MAVALVDRMAVLKGALRDDSGRDRDVMHGFEAFSSYQRCDMDLKVEFYAGKGMPKGTNKACFLLAKENSKDVYEQSGYGWFDDEKQSELREPSARFLVVKDVQKDEHVVAFLHFRFTLQGELVDCEEGEPAIIVYDIQVAPAYQRKGLGKHLMQLIELIADRYHIGFVMAPLIKGDPRSVAFFQSKLKGYEKSVEYGEDEHQVILCKDVLHLKAGSQKRSKDAKVSNRMESPNSVVTARSSPSDLPLGASGDANASHSANDHYADDVLSQLMDLFRQQNGREATEAEVAQWMNTLREATAEGLRL